MIPNGLKFAIEELRMFKLRFEDGLAETRLMKSQDHYLSTRRLQVCIGAMTPDVWVSFETKEIELIAPAIDLGRDKKKASSTTEASLLSWTR